MSDQGTGSWPYRRSRIDPTAPALGGDGDPIGYGELAARVDRLAAALAATGIRHGDRVAHLGWNRPQAFELFFAVCRLGAVFVPVSPRLAFPELLDVLKDCAPAALFHDDDQRITAEVAAGGIARVCGPGGQEAMTEAGDAPPRRDVTLDDPAVILYTSGTTGMPKGAVLSHGSLLFNTVNQLAHVDVLSTDRALVIAPLFHATGLGQVGLPTLFKGGSLLVQRFSAGKALKTIEERRITAFTAVPTMLRMMSDDPAFEDADLSALRYVVYGGSPADRQVVDAWRAKGVTLLQGYGMTEAAPGVTLATERTAAAEPLSAGVPHFFTDLSVRTTRGGAGELWVRGPHLFTGYHGQPEATAEAMDDGWFRTGDAVRLDNGRLHVVDRVKDMFISGGENVYPAEVEARLDALEGVRESVVVGVDDAEWGQVGAAFVVLEDGARLTGEQIRERLRGELAAFKVPRSVRFVPRLPRTPTGKIRRTDLVARLAREAPPDA
ncbi:AMP-binding protein [Streptomyces misionensis]|uniref:AMP-binding protein n=1 Tax=Streptomyces misionensis TaxID=67331 RepID=UPI00382E3949